MADKAYGDLFIKYENNNTIKPVLELLRRIDTPKFGEDLNMYLKRKTDEADSLKLIKHQPSLEETAGLAQRPYITPPVPHCTGQFQTAAANLSRANEAYLFRVFLTQGTNQALTLEQEKKIREALGKISEQEQVIYGALGMKIPSELDLMLERARRKI